MMPKDAIECFFVAIFGLIISLLTYKIAKPFIKIKEEVTKKKYILIFKIIIVVACISSIYLTVLGILIITGFL